MTKSSIRLIDLCRYYRHGTPHQMAAIAELEAAILEEAPTAFNRDQPWFRTWSQGGKQHDYAPAIRLIKEFEGCHLEAYADPLHGWSIATIGYGTTRYVDGRKVQRGDKITAAEAERLLEHEVDKIAKHLATVIPHWVGMLVTQKSALISFAYNLGTYFYGNPGFNTINTCLRDKAWAKVPAALELYRNPGTNVEAGLLRRRRAEGALWSKGPDGAAQQSPKLILIGPKKRPQDFGFKKGDSHLIINDAAETIKAFSFKGKLLWEIPCLARGQYSDCEWKIQKSDTPPGLYKLGKLYDDHALYGDKGMYDRTLMAYGWAFYDLIELENQETGNGREGIGIHGGGSALGWPEAWAPNQKLLPTHGCVRCRNFDLINKILPLYKQGTVFCSVFQESL